MTIIESTRLVNTAAHTKSLQGSVQDVSAELARVLGRNLVARIVGKDARTIQRWSVGQTAPSSVDEQKLRDTFQIYRLLNTVEGDHTIRAWFMGMNPQLDDESPADAITNGEFKAVISAARAFVNGA